LRLPLPVSAGSPVRDRTGSAGRHEIGRLQWDGRSRSSQVVPWRRSRGIALWVKAGHPLAMHAPDWIALAGVAVAIAAVLTALYQERIKRWLLTPEIEVKESLSLAWIRLKPDDYALWAYVRLRIGVKPGRTSACQVQVYLISCEPPPRLGGVKEMPDSEFLMPLRWSFTESAAVEIPPGGARYLDILEAISRPPGKAGAFLTTVRRPNEGYRLVGQGNPYKICVQIMGDNLNPKRYEFCILNTGIWDGTEATLAGNLETYAVSQLT